MGGGEVQRGMFWWNPWEDAAILVFTNTVRNGRGSILVEFMGILMQYMGGCSHFYLFPVTRITCFLDVFPMPNAHALPICYVQCFKSLETTLHYGENVDDNDDDNGDDEDDEDDEDEDDGDDEDDHDDDDDDMTMMMMTT